MEKKKLSGKWLNSLDYKIWSIAFEIADPEAQIEQIKHLVREEIKEAFNKGSQYILYQGVEVLNLEDYLTSKEL